MTKFEQVGVNYQYSAPTKEMANKSFAHSCNVCCHKGIHLDCDRCAISEAHNMVIAYFNGKEVVA